ncbi:hypothetical protein [Pseudoclavibacter sp. CFCC 13611]|uniref:SCO4225 family membrane protein n=1 Tax=Pseudoclavibacter sp. CFCC 13611 TaxID=2615178 RepID=UPI0013010665|nr:hypothetical protein [Pseudoclavibacter sp. CFCC 13611]KAB1663504.1 hypothetical protein F8O08_07115 [Pseudoclavibacter sp. CFCC 13611]
MHRQRQSSAHRVPRAYLSAVFSVSVGWLAHTAVEHHAPSAFALVIAVVLTAPVLMLALRCVGQWGSAVLAVALGQGILHVLLSLDQSASSLSGGGLPPAVAVAGAHHHGAGSAVMTSMSDTPLSHSIASLPAHAMGPTMLVAHGLAIVLCLLWLGMLPSTERLVTRLLSGVVAWLTLALQPAGATARLLQASFADAAHTLRRRCFGSVRTLRGPPVFL